MQSSFKIQNEVLFVDVDKTKKFYSTQIKIVDDCKCDDCNYFSNIFTKENLEIFNFLRIIGVDLGKNLRPPNFPGVWCVRKDNGDLFYCEQDFEIFGSLLSNQKTKFKYDKQENGFQIDCFFLQLIPDKILVQLNIQKLEDQKKSQ